MAASMPAWVTRTIEFLSHPLGSTSATSVGRPERPQRALLSVYQAPNRRGEKLGKRKARSRKARPQVRGPRFPVTISHTAEQQRLQDRSTQTDDLPDSLILRSGSIGGAEIPSQVSRDVSAHAQMDVDESTLPRKADIGRQSNGYPAYTYRGARVIMAKDGAKHSLALLLTSELVAEINRISARSKRLELLINGLKKAKRDLRSEENMLEYNCDSLPDTKDQTQLERMKGEIEEIRERIDKGRKRVATLDDEVETLTINLAHSRYRCEEILEGALEKVNLLDVPDTEPAMDMDAAGDQEKRTESIAASERETPKPELEPDQQDEVMIQREQTDILREIAREDFETKREILMAIDEAFDHRQEDLAVEMAEYRRCVREGICNITQTEFDLLALQDFRKMTANLRDAQEAFEEAFRYAKQLGALDERDAHYQESVFSTSSGGYALSMENAMIGSAPTRSIADWQAGVEQGFECEEWENLVREALADPERNLGASEVEDCDLESIAISDSWSCVDWSRNRRRIDRWREIAGRDR